MLYIPLVVFIVILTVLLVLLNHNNELNSINHPNYDYDDIRLSDANIFYSANSVSYSGVESGITRDTIQGAIDELYVGLTGDCFVGYTKGSILSNQYTCTKNTASSPSTTSFNGENVRYDNSNGLDSTNIQDAIDELASKDSYCASGYYKTNETSTSYDCYTMCHDMVKMNVTYGSYKSCNASCPTTSGRQYRDVYNHMYSSYDNTYFCETQTVTNGDYKSCSITCGYWYYTDDYTDPWGVCGCGASYCSDNMFCKKKCELHGWSGTWACTTSGSDKPTKTSQSTGGHCWCWRT